MLVVTIGTLEGHGFHDGVTHSFGECRKNEDVAYFQELLDVIALSEEANIFSIHIRCLFFSESIFLRPQPEED